MDEVLSAALLLAATAVAAWKAFRDEVGDRTSKVYSILALAAGGLFVLVADTALKALDAAFGK